MVTEDVQRQVLEHLQKKGQRNTFRLARELGIDRHKLLNVIRLLHEKEAIELRHGNAIFLKFPSEEKKAKIVEKIPSAPKIGVKSNELSAQKSRFREKTKLLGSLQYENKKLKDRLSELEAGIKRQHYTKSKKFREQDELIEKLENRIKALQEKAKTPKIITRKIEVPKIITKTIVKRIINLPDIKNIQRLERPEFLEQKIRAGKINFSGLNKNIQQLHVPGILKRN